MATTSNLLRGWLYHELAQRKGYLWDRRAARYRDRATGRFVAESRVLSAADGFREFTRSNIGTITDRFIEGRIDLSTWQQQMAQEIKDAHLVNAMAGRGGRNAMTQSDWGRVGARLRGEYQALDNFAREIKDGQLSAAEIKARAALYGDGAKTSLNDARMVAAAEAEVNLEWVVGPTEHCGDCLRLNGQVHSPAEWAASGWQPQSPRLECRGYRCQCSLVPTDKPESGNF